jgi:hypothetical protein
MANLNPIPVGNSSRIPSLLLSSGNAFVLRNPGANVSILEPTSRGPVLKYSIAGGIVNSKTVSGNFDDNKRELYSSPSPYTNRGFGPKQPFIVKKPGEEYTRLDDIVRISKYSITGKGILFYAKQFLLQRQAPYNETNVYNPLSPIASTVRGAAFGLTPRVKRHIDTDNGVLAGLLGSIGVSENNTTPPKGTAGEKSLESLSSTQQENVKGNIRAKTGASARERLISRFGTPSNKSGGFLSNLGSSLISSLGFGKLPDQFKDVKLYSGNTYYRADQDAYWVMLNYHRGKLEENSKIYGILDGSPTNRYKFDIKYGPGGVDRDISPYSEYVNGGDESRSLIIRKHEEAKVGWEDTNLSSPIYKRFSYFQRPPTPYGAETLGVEKIETGSDLNKKTVDGLSRSNITLRPSSVIINYNQIGKSIPSLERSDSMQGLSGFAKADDINLTEIKNDTEDLSPDQIKFFFHDVVNKKIIQFRAILSGITDNEAVEWEDIKYIGRPDTLYNYKGFTRTLNFSFVVNVSSIKELHPTWKRINYLKSMSRPAKYIEASFMVPPMVKINIGDIFNSLPCVISSLSVNIPDDAPWEILPDGDEYSYSNDLVKEPNVKVGQYPTRVEISIVANVLEKDPTPKVGGVVYGPSDPTKKFKLSI